MFERNNDLETVSTFREGIDELVSEYFLSEDGASANRGTENVVVPHPTLDNLNHVGHS